jgi:hypothetical protein
MRKSLLITAMALTLTTAAVPQASATGHAPHSCAFLSPQRSGGISEMAACGKSGVRGNRAEFVGAITRPVENGAFLSQLPH